MYTFTKEEKLCSKKLLDALFSEGSSFISYPLRISFLKYSLESNFPVQVVFVAAKKRYRRANRRNRLKRLMREAYRLQKNDLYEELKRIDIKILLSINYIGSEELCFQQILLQTNNALTKLKTQIINKLKIDESN